MIAGRRMDPEDDAKHKRQKKDGQAARHAANVNSNVRSICASCGWSKWTLKLSVKKLYQP
ncbi:hypothetical protein VTP01DRAFT_7231 [Rhizomucor pusillus]|uniref:uncharacterized protein n=1 Tax=Rhizomucor pusillus TaxID=4840 RepID=UPI003742143C